MGDEEDGDGEGLCFWEIGGYKRTTKRITEGNQLCSDLAEMVQERAEIETKTAAMLKSWSKKWAEKIEKGKNVCSQFCIIYLEQQFLDFTPIIGFYSNG